MINVMSEIIETPMNIIVAIMEIIGKIIRIPRTPRNTPETTSIMFTLNMPIPQKMLTNSYDCVIYSYDNI